MARRKQPAHSFYDGSVVSQTTEPVRVRYGAPFKPNATAEQNEKIAYAWQISKGEKAFVFKLETENDQWNPELRSSVFLRWGDPLLGENSEKVYTCNTKGDTWTSACKQEQSYGFCQIHLPSHPKIVNDTRFFTDWKWQMRECYRLHKRNTPMYGSKKISKVINRFQFKK